jgi:hypothetical protein
MRVHPRRRHAQGRCRVNSFEMSLLMTAIDSVVFEIDKATRSDVVATGHNPGAAQTQIETRAQAGGTAAQRTAISRSSANAFTRSLEFGIAGRRKR